MLNKKVKNNKIFLILILAMLITMFVGLGVVNGDNNISQQPLAATEPTALPVIIGNPIAGDTSISGTAAPGANIVLCVNGTEQPAVTADVSTGTWTVSGLTLISGDLISVTAQLADKPVSAAATAAIAAINEMASPLTSLSITYNFNNINHELIDDFDGNKLSYSAEVDNEIGHVHLFAGEADNTTVKVFLDTVEILQIVNLEEGANKIIIVVSETDKADRIYYITVTRKKISKVYPPVTNPHEGKVPIGTQVSLSSSSPNAKIYFTTDGTIPTSSSSLYTEPITINTETTIKAMASKSGIDSEIMTAVFTISNTPLTIADAVLDPDQPIIYMTSKTEKRLYATNYITGEFKIIDFEEMPESLELGKGEYANEIYVALLSREHDSYSSEDNQSGKIAVIDRRDLSLKDTMEIQVDPYDLVAGRDGCLYITSGSDDNIDSYNRSTKQRIDRRRINDMSHAQLHPILDRIYTVTANLFPRNYTTYSFSNGIFTDYYKPYHGDYPLNEYFTIDPTGLYLFNGSGIILSTALEKSNDMKYVGKLEDSFNAIAFEDNSSRFYVLTNDGTQICTIDGFSYEKLKTVSIEGQGDYLFKQGNKLIVLAKNQQSDASYHFEVIEIEQEAAVTDLTLDASPASPQPAGNSISLTASSSGSNNPEYRFWAKEATDTWKIIQDWSANSNCNWIPRISGKAELRVEARSTGTIGAQVSKTISYMVLTGVIKGAWGMPSVVSDVTIDPDTPIVYMSNKVDKRLYVVNYLNGDTSIIGFEEMPESLELGKGEYANELYVALLSRDHDSNWDEKDQSGKIAVIDRRDLSLKDTIEIQVDPYDLVAGRDGCLYIPSGSGQWTNFDSYNRSSKQRIGRRWGIDEMSLAQLHPTLDRIYTITTDSSMRDYTAYSISNGNFTNEHDSPYRGSYPLTKYFAIDPTGRYLINGSGIIFSTALENSDDMKYVRKLTEPFNAIVFEADSSRFYTLKSDGKQLYTIDGFSYEKLKTVSIEGQGQYLLKQGNKLIVLAKNQQPDPGYHFEVIEIEQEQAVTDLNIDASPASPQPAGSNISLTASSSGGNNPEYRFWVKEATDTWKIIQDWSANSSCNWIPRISGKAELRVEARSTGAIGAQISKTISYTVLAGVIKGAWAMPSVVSDVTIDPDTPIVYISDKVNKRLYVVNYLNGDTSIIGFEEMPESLELGKGEYANELYVALLSRNHDSYWQEEDQSGKIAVIDRRDLSFKDTIEIQVDPYDIVAGRDGCLYIPSGSGQWTNFDSYNRSSKQRIGRRSGIDEMTLAQLHPTLNRIYTVDAGDYNAYNISSGTFSDCYESSERGYPLTKHFSIDPTGRYLYNGSGTIFSTALEKSNDMKYVGKLAEPFNAIVFEADSSRFYTLKSDGKQVCTIDGFSYEKLKAVTIQGQGQYLLKQGNKLIVLAKNQQPDPGYHFEVIEIEQEQAVTDLNIDASPASPQPAGSNISLAASSSGGNNPEYRFWVKEATDTWKIIQDWSANSSCNWMPRISGKAELRVEARSTGAIGAQISKTISYTVLAGVIKGAWAMPSVVSDVTIGPDNPIVYMSDKVDKRLYVVNYLNGDTSIIGFEEMPESLELGKGEYANELYVALLSRDHSSYWWDKDQSGKIAVIDRRDLSLKDTIEIQVDPYDIVAGRDGCLYIPSGSGQWTNFDSYNRSSKQRIGRRSRVSEKILAQLHPILDRIYTVTTNLFPRDYTAYGFSNGSFTNYYDSPYHGDYPLNEYFSIDPTGRYLYNGSGTILSTALEKSNDMKYVGKLDQAFNGIAFAPDKLAFYILPQNKRSVDLYDAGNNLRTNTISLEGEGKYIFRQDENLIILIKKPTSNNLFLQVIPLQQHSDATLQATSTVKGQTVTSLGTPNANLDSVTAGTVTITTAQAADTTGTSPYATLFEKSDASAATKTVKYNSGADISGFATDTAYANEAISNNDFFIIRVTAANANVLYYKIVVAVTVSPPPTPTVTSVSVEPAAVSVRQGSTRQFNAVVTGTNDPPQTATWAVYGGVKATSISNAGLLSISAKETAETLTVKATSTLDTGKFDTAIVTVIYTSSQEGGISDGGSYPTTRTGLIKNTDSTGTVTLTAAELSKASTLTINGNCANLVFSADLLAEMNITISLSVTIKPVNPDEIPPAARAVVGNRPVFDIRIIVDGKEITGLGKLYIEIPYTPQEGEDTSKLAAFFIGDDATVTQMTSSKYDSEKKAVVFTTDHQSIYAVGLITDQPKVGKPDQNKAVKKFTDVVSGSWEENYIYYLANRGIISGKTETTFVPNDYITRAEFVAILAKMSGNSLPQGTNNFSDVLVNVWYAPHVSWASQKGIAQGYAGQFNPNDRISRQDMAVMLVNYADKVGKYPLPLSNAAFTFTDDKAISGYARSAVYAMQQAGIISGRANKSFDPKANASRAEAAKMAAMLLQGIEK